MQCTLHRSVLAALCLGSFVICQISHATTREAAEAPGIIRTGWPETSSPEVSKLLDDLHSAKKAGDMDAARAIENELARLRGGYPEIQPEDPASEHEVQFIHSYAAETQGGDRWMDNDILIRGTDHGEIKPVIAGDSQGVLWAAFEHTDLNTVMLCRSTTGGQSWSFYASLGHPTIDHCNVSIAVARGNEEWVLVAIQYGTTDLWVWRESIDGSGVFDTQHVYECPDGLSNPRIVTDASEYSAYYAYLVFNAMTVEGWAVCFSRSVEYGANWQAVPDIIGWHCGGWNARENRPNIDFGSRTLYAAYSTPVAPCSDSGQEIFVNRSTDFGVTWSGEARLTSNTDLEFDPTVGAIKNYATNKTAVIAYSRFYHGLDNDVWYTATQDGGATWSTNRCISCLADNDEQAPDIETSVSLGAFHVAYYHDHAIDYKSAAYTTPATWALYPHLNDDLYASSDYPRPAVAVNPTLPTDLEAGICWTDERNLATNSYDIYYDGPAASDVATPEPVAASDEALDCCGPNPFTEATEFCFELPEASEARLVVIDVTGRVVRTLAEGRHAAGEHRITWNGLGADAARLRAGVYLVRLQTPRTTASRSVTILR